MTIAIIGPDVLALSIAAQVSWSSIQRSFLTISLALYSMINPRSSAFYFYTYFSAINSLITSPSSLYSKVRVLKYSSNSSSVAKRNSKALGQLSIFFYLTSLYSVEVIGFGRAIKFYIASRTNIRSSIAVLIRARQ